MRFFETVLAGAALVAAALALEINDFPPNPEAGKTYTITYSPKDNTPTQILLRKGDSNNLDTVATLGTATGGSFQWTVDSALPSGTNYAIQVKQGDTVNYSKQFPISGGSSASASASASSASASASSVSASVSSALSSAISSALSSASSAASVATLTTSASASVSSSAGTNTTISSATLSASKSGAATTGKATGSSTASGGGAPTNTGAASALGSSPLALIFGAVAAIAYVN